MNIFYDKEKTTQIEERIWAKYGSDSKEWAKKGYNVSECTYCEMKQFNRRCGGLKQSFTKKNIGFLVFGIVSEQIVMDIYPDEQKQFSVNLNELVWGHVDVMDSGKYPVEGKATAKRIYKREHLPVKWVIQLLNYIVISGAPKGWLLILDIWTRTFSAWCLEVDSDEALMQIQILMDKVTRFDKKDPSILKVVPEQFGLCGYKKECSRRVECNKGFRLLQKKKEAERKAKKKLGAKR